MIIIISIIILSGQLEPAGRFKPRFAPFWKPYKAARTLKDVLLSRFLKYIQA